MIAVVVPVSVVLVLAALAGIVVYLCRKRERRLADERDIGTKIEMVCNGNLDSHINAALLIIVDMLIQYPPHFITATPLALFRVSRVLRVNKTTRTLLFLLCLPPPLLYL